MEENNHPPAGGPNTPPVESLPTEQIPATAPTNPKSKLPVLITIVVLIISVVVGSFFILNWYIRMQELGGSTACTMEAMICPNGTSVGRTGPNCEFSPCPTPDNEQSCGGIAGEQCPSGYDCQYDGDYPDASGICIKASTVHPDQIVAD